MPQPTAASLFQTFNAVTESAGRLGAQLVQAGKDLQETGELPDERLIEELETFRRHFLDLRRQGSAAADALALPSVPSAAALTSLGDIKTLIQGIAKLEEQQALYDDIYQRALAMLDRVLLLQHRETSTFPPLLDCQERAREMREAVAAARWPHLHPATESLASGEDPFSDLLIWIEQQETLDDDEWAVLQDTVEQFFGKPLAIAVSRGKLLLPSEAPTIRALLPSPDNAIPTDFAKTSDTTSFILQAEAEASELTLTVEPFSNSDEVFVVDEAEKIVSPLLSSVEQASEAEQEELMPIVTEAPVLPETVPLGGLYGFGLEDSAQQIAVATAAMQDATQRTTSFRDLTWRLLLEDKVSLAFHLASYLDTQHPQLQPRLPAWLPRALLLGRHVRHARGETARFLEGDFAHFSPTIYLPEQSEWNQAFTFLLASAALQPALLAPQTQAPAVLHALRWEADLPQFTTYCKSIADYGGHQHPLDPNLLKKGKEQAAWQAEMDVLKQGVELWWARGARLPFSYAPATKVWQKWLEPKGVIATLLSPIRHSDTNKVTAVKRAADLFSDDTQLKREVEHTDRDILGRRLGNDINGRALEQLRLHTREAIGFARRWIELQEIHSGQRQGSAQERAERLRQAVWNLQGAVQEELNLFKRRNPSPLILSSLACCRRALENLQLLFDPEAAFPTEEPLPRPLLYADLLRIPTVSLNEQWEVEGSDWGALVDGVLDLVANGSTKKVAA